VARTRTREIEEREEERRDRHERRHVLERGRANDGLHDGSTNKPNHEQEGQKETTISPVCQVCT